MLDVIVRNSTTDAEKEVIVCVLIRLLDRIPTMEDYNLLSVIKKEGEFFKYTLCYNKKALGEIRRKYKYPEYPELLTVSFTPLFVLN